MTVDPTDANLAARIAAGADREAEAELCQRMGPRIRLYGLRHLRDRHAAEDLMQQVLITTIEALRAGRLLETEKLSSFVLGTSRMMVLNQHRSTRRRGQLLEQFGVEMLSPSPAPRPRVDYERLTKCVQRLKERERAVVTHSFYGEEEGADIARFLGVSEANVRVIRHRAIHLLRDCMGVTR
jgi:RNA polymerase sigma-70 factor (ECF subfamily)